MKKATKISRVFPALLFVAGAFSFALAGCGGGSETAAYTANNTSVNQISERFPVSGDAAYRYQLASPIDAGAPVEVSWRDQPLAENVDYQLNREARYVLLKRVLPPDTTETGVFSLLIKYKPQQQASLSDK